MILNKNSPRFSIIRPAGILAAAMVSTLLLSCNNLEKDNQPVQAKPSDSIPAIRSEPKTLFGIRVDSFMTIKGHIRPNRFLSEILAEYGVSPSELDKVTRNSAGVFNVRKMRAWNDYTIMADTDSVAKVRYFIYEHEPGLNYIFSFNDSLNITPFRHESRSVVRFQSVTIESSLWDAMTSNGINPELAVELSDVYAWTVDFFGLQKGDRFKVIYEERYIDEKPAGIGKIYAAEYTASGTSIHALPVIQDGKESFYDTAGTSLRKAFLKSPLRYSRISSRYSSGRMHPVLRIVRPHHGVDYAAPVGTPVYSIGDGRVISAGFQGESGRIVRIRHNSVYSTAYLHLAGFAKGIAAGALVRQGDIIGYVGNSGLSTGPHLDFRIYKNGYAVDPLKVEAPPVEPVREENLGKFNKIRRIYTELLNTID